MTTTLPRPRAGFLVRLAVLALMLAPPLFLTPPASAAPSSPPAASAAPVLPLADGEKPTSWWTFSWVLTGLNNRTRIIQFCAVIMCLALFILMKK
jgi:hypothetical protein